jgi:hypothetical protein
MSITDDEMSIMVKYVTRIKNILDELENEYIHGPTLMVSKIYYEFLCMYFLEMGVDETKELHASLFDEAFSKYQQLKEESKHG